MRKNLKSNRVSDLNSIYCRSVLIHRSVYTTQQIFSVAFSLGFFFLHEKPIIYRTFRLRFNRCELSQKHKTANESFYYEGKDGPLNFDFVFLWLQTKLISKKKQ